MTGQPLPARGDYRSRIVAVQEAFEIAQAMRTIAWADDDVTVRRIREHLGEHGGEVSDGSLKRDR